MKFLIPFKYISRFSVHPCDQEDKGGCEQVCTKNDDLAVCGCNQGYKVSTTDPKKCTASKSKTFSKFLIISIYNV